VFSGLAAAPGRRAAPPTGSTAYSYKSRGDQTAVTPSAGLATSYGYDLADRLTSYVKGTTSWSYAYDGDGLRSSKAPSGGTAVAFTYDVAEGLPLIASDGSAYYITGPGGLPLEQTDLSGNPTAYFHHDQIGSTRALTSPAGAVSTFSWSPWGQSAASSGTLTTPFGWAGQYADSESGLVWLRARYYNPSTGQFLTRDPLVAPTGEAYGYAGNDALNSEDPSGLFYYTLKYDLGSSDLSPEEFMSSVAFNFGQVFPVHGHAMHLEGVGQRMGLSFAVVPGHVRVSRVTSTGWRFDTEFPHGDWPDGWVQFMFSRSCGHMFLNVHAYVPYYSSAGLPLLAPMGVPFQLKGLYRRFADHILRQFARNLRTFDQELQTT
jgi:RHS repeat-associated protein